MFALKLKELREESGYSQYSFAAAFGCAQSTVGNWEAGKREPPYKTLVKIADFFNVTTDYLLGRTDDPKIHVIENPKQLEPLGVTEIRRTGTEPFTDEQLEAIRKVILEERTRTGDS